MGSAGVELLEIKDWTCCGASAADSTSYLLSLALPARNIAIAEKTDDGMDILGSVQCLLSEPEKSSAKNRAAILKCLKQLNSILAEDQLQISGRMNVRHLLDVLATDMGPETIRHNLKRAFTGLSDCTVLRLPVPAALCGF